MLPVSAAMNLFTLGPFLGPSLGPILSGFINQHANWRWTYYVALIWTGVQFIVLLMVPETYAPALLKHRAQKLRKRTGNQRIRAQAELDHENLLSDIRKSCITPFEIILREPMALLLDIWTSVVLGILCVVFCMRNRFRKLKSYFAGIPFLPVSVSYLVNTAC